MIPWSLGWTPLSSAKATPPPASSKACCPPEMGLQTAEQAMFHQRVDASFMKQKDWIGNFCTTSCGRKACDLNLMKAWLDASPCLLIVVKQWCVSEPSGVCSQSSSPAITEATSTWQRGRSLPPPEALTVAWALWKRGRQALWWGIVASRSSPVMPRPMMPRAQVKYLCTKVWQLHYLNLHCAEAWLWVEQALQQFVNWLLQMNMRILKVICSL